MNKPVKITLHSTAHYFLEGLNEIGIEYLFCNLGTDHAPLIEAMARWASGASRTRRPSSARTRTSPCTWPAGYAIATGRGQGVMVHVDAGTANAAMALHNLFRARMPVLLMAGKSPYTHARRTRRLARQLRAFRAGALRPGEPRAALRQVGVHPADRRGRQGSAAPRAHADAERPEGAGLPDAAARDARRDLGCGGGALVSGGALRPGAPRAGPTRAGGGARRRGCSRRDDPLLVTAYRGRNPAERRAARRAGALRRHPRASSSIPLLPQHRARFALLRGLHARRQRGEGRLRPAARRRRAVDPA